MKVHELRVGDRFRLVPDLFPVMPTVYRVVEIMVPDEEPKVWMKMEDTMVGYGQMYWPDPGKWYNRDMEVLQCR